MDYHHTNMEEPATMPARPDGSCDGHKDHGASQPMRLVNHHVFPKYLQVDAIGEVVDKTFAELCDNGHMAAHAIIDDILKNNLPIDKLPDKYRAYNYEWHSAVSAVMLYRNALAQAGHDPATHEAPMSGVLLPD